MINQPRTLLVSPFLDPGVPSGGVLYSVDVVREWLRRGRTVQVLCSGQPRWLGDLEAWVAQGRLSIEQMVDPGRTRFTHHSDSGLYAQVRETVRSFQPDIIHVHNIHGMMSAAHAAVDGRVPVILTALDFGLLCFNFYLYDGTIEPCDGPVSTGECARCVMQETRGPARWVGRFLPRSVTRRWWPTFVRLDQSKSAAGLHKVMRHVRMSLDAVIAPSPIVAERFSAFGTPEDRIVEVPYGISPEKIVRPKKVLSERMRFAYFGNAEPVEGLQVVIEALDCLPDNLPMEITAFGDERVKHAIADASPRARRYLTYHKPLFGAALAREHARIDAVLMPSLWHENSPFAVLEALANGTPVIAADQAGIRHLVLPDHTGWLIEPGKPAVWTRAFIRAIERPAVIRSMQINARFDRTTGDFLDDVEQLEQQLVGLPSLSASVPSTA